MKICFSLKKEIDELVEKAFPGKGNVYKSDGTLRKVKVLNEHWTSGAVRSQPADSSGREATPENPQKRHASFTPGTSSAQPLEARTPPEADPRPPAAPAPSGGGRNMSKFKASTRGMRMRRGNGDPLRPAILTRAEKEDMEREAMRMSVRGVNQPPPPPPIPQDAASFSIHSRRLDAPITVAPAIPGGPPLAPPLQPSQQQDLVASATSTTESLPSGSPLKTPFKSRKSALKVSHTWIFYFSF